MRQVKCKPWPALVAGRKPQWRTLVRSAALPALLSLALAALPSPATGQIQARNVIIKLIDQVDLPAREAGLLEAVMLREGDTIERGGIVARLESDDIQLLREQTAVQLEIAQVEAADEASLREAEGELKVARAELERAEKSRARLEDSVSDAEYDRLLLAVIKGEAKVAKCQTELKIARLAADLKRKDLEFTELQLKRRTIVSPIDGVVVQVYRRPGEWLETGDKIARVIRLTKLRAEGFVDVADLKTDLTGAKAAVTVELPGREPVVYAGHVVFVSPEIDTFNRQVRIWAEIDNVDSRLQPGAPAKMILTPTR